MKSCAQRIQQANPNAIVFFSGLNFDTDFSAVTAQKNLDEGKRFLKEDFLPGKIALELHNYQNSAKNCNAITGGLYRNGWNALNATNPLVLLVVMTAFGLQQNMTTANSPYAQCLKGFSEK